MGSIQLANRLVVICDRQELIKENICGIELHMACFGPLRALLGLICSHKNI